VTIAKEPGDDEILKNTVDFVSFSYYASRCASAEMNANNTNAANIVKSLKNPHIRPVNGAGALIRSACASP
jgi:6-phospho-beta-glucosidase